MRGPIVGTPLSESFTPTYFPGTADAAHAAPIEVSAGAPSCADLIFGSGTRCIIRYAESGPK